MARRILIPVAVGLIALGALADHLLNPASSQPTVAATTATTSAASGTSATLSAAVPTSIDAAIEHAYAVASASVVYVDNAGVGTGSGIIYDANGDIVTNAHVVQGASSLKVTLNNGRTYSARLLGTDAADDVAVIHINASGLTPATFASAGSFQVAQTVLAIGSPLGLKQSVTSGLISGVNRVAQEPDGAYIPDAIQTSAPINPGNSGGALVTLSGVVVGMPTLEQTGTQDGAAAQSIGFAVPSFRIVDVAGQIIRTGKVEHTGRAYLGIAPGDPSSSSGNPFGGFFGQGGTPQNVSGAVVNQVSATGPAGQAGVQQGDVITAVDGQQISNAEDLLAILAQKKPGDTVSLSINRGGSTVTIHVRLGEMPAS